MEKLPSHTPSMNLRLNIGKVLAKTLNGPKWPFIIELRTSVIVPNTNSVHFTKSFIVDKLVLVIRRFFKKKLALFVFPFLENFQNATFFFILGTRKCN